MNHVKNKLLIVLTIMTTSILPRGGGNFGGGFATGAILGTGLTLAATSGNRGDRSDAYYENKQIQRSKSEIHRQIRDEERQKKKAERELNKAQNNNNENRVKELKEEIKSHKETIKDLKEDLRDLR